MHQSDEADISGVLLGFAFIVAVCLVLFGFVRSLHHWLDHKAKKVSTQHTDLCKSPALWCPRHETMDSYERYVQLCTDGPESSETVVGIRVSVHDDTLGRGFSLNSTSYPTVQLSLQSCSSCADICTFQGVFCITCMLPFMFHAPSH